jgi:hypothetical protein
LPKNLIAKPAPNIIERNAIPQNATMKTPTPGDSEKPLLGINELRFSLP